MPSSSREVLPGHLPARTWQHLGRTRSGELQTGEKRGKRSQMPPGCLVFSQGSGSHGDVASQQTTKGQQRTQFRTSASPADSQEEVAAPAHGHCWPRSGWGMVGERGRQTLTLPGAGGGVFPSTHDSTPVHGTPHATERMVRHNRVTHEH